MRSVQENARPRRLSWSHAIERAKRKTTPARIRAGARAIGDRTNASVAASYSLAVVPSQRSHAEGGRSSLRARSASSYAGHSADEARQRVSAVQGDRARLDHGRSRGSHSDNAV